MEVLCDAASVGHDAAHALVGEAVAHVGKESNRGHERGDHDWLEYIEFEVTLYHECRVRRR